MFCGAEQFVKFWLKTLKVTILWNYFNFGLVVQEQMLFKDISYLELWRPLHSVERNHLYNFDRGYPEEQFCRFILNLDLWFGRCR